jgi:hypothetical protein
MPLYALSIAILIGSSMIARAIIQGATILRDREKR